MLSVSQEDPTDSILSAYLSGDIDVAAAKAELQAVISADEAAGFGVSSEALESSAATQWLALLAPGESSDWLSSIAGVQTVYATDHLADAFIIEFAEPHEVDSAMMDFASMNGAEALVPLVPLEYKLDFTPNDPLFVDQWHLENTGQTGGTAGADANITSAWDTALGTGVVIGVVDSGTQFTHPDLISNYLASASYDFIDNDPDPTPDPMAPGAPHGTSVAGVAAGRGNNSVGISGAAPEANFAGLRLIVDGAPITDLQIADALSHSSSVIDIYNNSWGPVFAPDIFFLAGPGILSQGALQQGVTSGRDGLGNIYVFSAGNDLLIDANVNYNGFANSRYTIAVSAIGDDGKQSAYSEPGAPILVAGYSSDGVGVGITTTDLLGADGYDPGDYTDSFGGTSSAAPLVSGVVALMLDANPELSYRDVQHILVNTAEQNDPTDLDWTTNSAGHLINHKYGFGAIDATAAVISALGWTPVGPEVSTTTGTINVDAVIPDNDPTGVEDSVDVAGNLNIEWVEVVFDADHEYRGDLELVLTAPDGTESVLSEAHLDPGEDFDHWTFTTARHWDTQSAGTWTLKVSDRSELDVGTWNSWQLNFYGTTVPTSPLSVETNDGDVLSNNDVLNVAPTSLTFFFDMDDIIGPTSLDSLTVTRAGDDGFLHTIDDVEVPLGFVGLADRPHQMIARFAEALPDDLYNIDIADGPGFTLDFELDLGAQVLAVVPQPVTREMDGSLSQARNEIVVYFNDDDLDPTSAETFAFYQLISTVDNSVVLPTSVVYDSVADTAVLTFGSVADLADLPNGPGTYRLRIGDSDAQPAAPQPAMIVGDAGSSFGLAANLGSLGTTQIISEQILNPITYNLQLPGGNDEPGHRDLAIPFPGQQHVGGADNQAGISTIYYNFRDDYGVAPDTGEFFHNAITENQKQRAREIFEFYSEYLGVEFVETLGQGLTIATGDLRAVAPVIPTGPGGVGGIAGGGVAVMDAAENWGNSEFGGGWFQTAMHEIGHLLGLGHTHELAPLTIMGSDGSQIPRDANNNPLFVEPVFPGEADIVHLQHLYRPESLDIDLYQFMVPETGIFTAEIIAERLDSPSMLDSQLTLFNGNYEIVARNDDYFSEDAFLQLELTSGIYYVAVTSTGNTDIDPRIENSGFGGTTQGAYELRLDFKAPAFDRLVDTTGVALDGDADGKEGGAYNYWFEIADVADTIFIDKDSAGGAAPLGSMMNPFVNIDDAFAASTAGDIVRIVGNDGDDDDPDTLDDNLAYEIGFDLFGSPLPDGTTMAIPRDVTVMVDAGAIFKIRRANIHVGSSTQGTDLSPLDRSEAALQVLGTPEQSVYFTSWFDETTGLDTDPFGINASKGDWGGIVIQDDIDRAYDRPDPEADGVFLNNINFADVRYGGGQVVVNSVLQTIAPIHLVETRPTISYGTFSNNAGAPISADPNSFEVTEFGDDSFDADYNRVGPDIYGNRLFANSINGLFIRTEAPSLPGTLVEVDVTARWDDNDIVHVVAENLRVAANVGGHDLTSGTETARLDGGLMIDPDVIVKLNGTRIETQFGGQFIAEGLPGHEVVFTSIHDDSFGAGGTFDTDANANTVVAGAGDWGGLFFGQLSRASLDHVRITNAGGITAIEGDFAQFNPVEIHQAEVRITNSQFVNNESGNPDTPSLGASGQLVSMSPENADEIIDLDIGRNQRGPNSPATIFVRGSQPIIVNNVVENNAGPAINIDVNSLDFRFKSDSGRSTGAADLFDEFDGNRGPLVAENRLGNNLINGMVVRGGVLTTQSVWDDTGIVHVVVNEISADNHHTYSGLRLESQPNESLVVKLLSLSNNFAGFTATGTPFEIDDRIGGTVQVVGHAGAPVVLTSLRDDTVGAGFDPDGNPQNNTDNADVTPVPGNWRSIRLEALSNDRNVKVVNETESMHNGGNDVNFIPDFAEFLGELASDQRNGDDNRQIGFEVHGAVSFDDPTDIDVYSFKAYAGTEIWIDVDQTRFALDAVVELVDANGTVIARSDDSPLESNNSSLLAAPALLMQRDAFSDSDLYTTNPRDGGMRVVLPGPAGLFSPYFVRVRSKGADVLNVTGGITRGQYQFQIRLQEVDEFPGSTVRYADIRFATNGIEVLGAPFHSPLLGTSTQIVDGTNISFATAQDLGNLLQSDQGTIDLSSFLAGPGAVQWYKFNVDLGGTQSIANLNDGGTTWSTIFDIDYADGLSRPDLSLAVFDDQGELVLISRDSNIADDLPRPQAGADTANPGTGSFGVLDPFIGSAELPEGDGRTYYVAVMSDIDLPSQLNATFQSDADNVLVRLEPVNSVTRIIEDHIGSTGYTSNGVPVSPTDGAILNIGNALELSTHIRPFTLSDVTLFIAEGGLTSDDPHLFTVDPYTGAVETNIGPLGDGVDDFADIVMRSDGQLFGYQEQQKASNFEDTAGQLVHIDPATAAQYVIGRDNIPDDAPMENPDDPETATINDIGALAYRRLGFDTDRYDLVYSVVDVKDPLRSYLWWGDPQDGHAGFQDDNRPDGILGVIDFANFPPGDPDEPPVDFIGHTTGMAYVQQFGFTLSAPDGSVISDGQTFSISDAEHTVTFEFDVPDSPPSFDYYSFDVGTADSVGTFDIDAANFDTELFLFDAGGNFLGGNDDATPDPGDSAFGLHSRFSYTFTTPGTYTIGVGKFDSDGAAGGITGELPDASDKYTLHISLENHAPGAGAGTVDEAEPNNTLGTAQNLESEGWVLTANPNIANALTVPHLTIDSRPATGVSGNHVPVVFSPTDTTFEVAETIRDAITNSGLNVELGDLEFGPLFQDFFTIFDAFGANKGDSFVEFFALPNDGYTLYGVSDLGVFYTIDPFSGLATFVNDFGTNRVFTGLAIGPQNLDLDGDGAGGDLRTTLFAITSNGDLYAIDSVTGELRLDVFEGGVDHVNVGIQNVAGLAFSNLDYNLWHPTEQDKGSAGHGINETFDGSRETGLPPDGGSSFYFGMEVLNDGYFSYAQETQFGTQTPNAQYGVLTTAVQDQLTEYTRTLAYNAANPDEPIDIAVVFGDWADELRDSLDTTIGNNYNLPGGAHGTLITDPFSLEGYSSGDKPTLYFNYFLDTEGAEAAKGSNTMRDSTRVFASTDGGTTWVMLSTNNSHLDAELPDFVSTSASASIFDPRQQVQDLFETTMVEDPNDPNMMIPSSDWRQARVDLGDLAGASEIVLRFDFATSGDISDPSNPLYSAPLPGDQFGNFNSGERGANNNFKGFFIDDIIIGFAERGEMVTAAAQGETGTFTVPLPDSPDFTKVFTGPYQLQIRRGDEYAVPADQNSLPIFVVDTNDTNDRSTEAFTIRTPAGVNISDGQAIYITDGLNDATFEFDTGDGVALGSVQVLFNGTESAAGIALKLESIINATSPLEVTARASGTDSRLDLFDAANVLIGAAESEDSGDAEAASTALADYVGTIDSSYDWSLDSTIVDTGYTAYVLDVTTQTWRSSADVDPSEWQHWVTVIVPDTVTSTTALLGIHGGTNSSSPPTSVDSTFADIALATQSVVVDLPTIPNQPTTFTDDGIPRTEDSIIAYTFDKYLETMDETWPLLLPMVKSAVRVMDASQDFLLNKSDGAVVVNDFVVTGGSKRGWTTYLTAAVDPRVVGIVPLVFNFLNMGPQVEHHRAFYEGNPFYTFGGYSLALYDYVSFDIPDRINTPEGASLGLIVDPYQYRDQLTMPKLLIHSTGDEFFVPDSAKYYINNLPGETYLRYIPNSGHGLSQAGVGTTEAENSLTTFYDALLTGAPLPEFSWSVLVDGTIDVDVEDTGTLMEVNLWQATNPFTRDFRWGDGLGPGGGPAGPTWSSTPLSDLGGGSYSAFVSEPLTGATAYMIELVFDSGAAVPFTFTTEVVVTSPIPLNENINDPTTFNVTKYESRGDRNAFFDRPLEKGEVILESNRISNSLNYGIFVDSFVDEGSPSDPNDTSPLPHTGAVRALTVLNGQQFVGGLTIENNVIANGGAGGIMFSGNSNPTDLAASAKLFGRIVNNTLYGNDTPTGTGIALSENVSPTILNNIVAGFDVGISGDATTTTSVIGGSVYQNVNTLSVGAATGAFGIVLGPSDPLFVDATTGNFLPAFGSKAIDSSIDILLDRPEMVAVNQPLGIGESPIRAPEFDVFGQLRQDDPDVPPPPGLGANVFRDRGAVERVAGALSPSISIGDVAMEEGDAGTTNMVFTVLLSSPSGQFVMVDYATSDGLAIEGDDYTGVSGTLTFVPGQTVRTISVPIKGDPTDEPDENFFVDLSNPVNATFSDDQAEGIIEDDDGVSTLTLSINNQLVQESLAGDSGTYILEFTVTLSGASGTPVMVDFATADLPGGGGATAGVDYTPTSGTLIFDGSLQETIPVEILGDTLPETNEIFLVNLANPVGAQIQPGHGQGTGTIVDDDDQPEFTLSINDIVIQEPVNVDGTQIQQANITVTLSQTTMSIVTFDIMTSDNTAMSPADYIPVNASFFILPGSLTASIPISVRGDDLVEGLETFNVNLSNVNQGGIADPLGVVTIVDPPGGGGGGLLSIEDNTVSESIATEADPGMSMFLVTLSEASADTVFVDYQTVNGSAMGDEDYTPKTGTIQFDPGMMEQYIEIEILGDATPEAKESFYVQLMNPVNASLSGAAMAEGMIQDDDGDAPGPPKVMEVLASGTDWDPLFFSHLATLGLGTGGYSIPTGSAAQLTTLPWRNVDKFKIRFSENVNVNENDLAVTGINVATYAFAPGGFSYDPSTFTATWMLAAPVAADRLVLTLSDAVRDVTDEMLDGEWVDGSSAMPSGEGTAGGAFEFGVNVLPGDASGNGMVQIEDFTLWADSFEKPLGTPGLERADFNADGAVDTGDFTTWADRFDEALPDAESSESQTLLGDASGNGIVDIEDFTIWADYVILPPGTPGWEQADFNNDGVVDIADYTIWADHFGETLGGGSGGGGGLAPLSEELILTGPVGGGGGAIVTTAADGQPTNAIIDPPPTAAPAPKTRMRDNLAVEESIAAQPADATAASLFLNDIDEIQQPTATDAARVSRSPASAARQFSARLASGRPVADPASKNRPSDEQDATQAAFGQLVDETYRVTARRPVEASDDLWDEALLGLLNPRKAVRVS